MPKDKEQPKRQRRCVIAVLLVVVITIGWIFRYCTVNRFFSPYLILHSEYSIGDIVELGENIIMDDSALGYAIAVTNSSIVPYEEYLLHNLGETVGFVLPDPPEYVLEVTLHLYNKNSKAAGIYLPDLILYSVDMYTDINYELTSLANPILEDGSYGISLAEGTEYDIRIVYNLRESLFSPEAFRQLNEIPFFLRLTSYPEEQSIRIQ